MAIKRGAIKKDRPEPIKLMSEEQKDSPARQISKTITAIDSDDRGNFLMEISVELRRIGQGYTGDLFEQIAKSYNGL
jgi:hypothetical protein